MQSVVNTVAGQAFLKKSLPHLSNMFFLIALATFSTNVEGAELKISNSDFLHNNASYLTQQCNSVGTVVTIQNKKVLCIVGTIRSNSIDFTLLKKSSFDFVYANSKGGHVNTAIEIGQIIHANRSILLISGLCLSSCANYLVPAANQVTIMKNSFVGFHGTPDRSEKIYLDKLNVSNVQLDKFGETLKEQHENILSKYRDSLIKEVNFYLDIGVEEFYATFYHHVYKKAKSGNIDACNIPTRLLVILGPKHAKEYGVNIVDSWFPSVRKDFDLLISEIPNYSLLFDMDGHPFFRRPNEFLDPNICDISIRR